MAEALNTYRKNSAALAAEAQDNAAREAKAAVELETKFKALMGAA
jgi:argininosuccinate lyase